MQALSVCQPGYESPVAMAQRHCPAVETDTPAVRGSECDGHESVRVIRSAVMSRRSATLRALLQDAVTVTDDDGGDVDPGTGGINNTRVHGYLVRGEPCGDTAHEYNSMPVDMPPSAAAGAIMCSQSWLWVACGDGGHKSHHHCDDRKLAPPSERTPRTACKSCLLWRKQDWQGAHINSIRLQRSACHASRCRTQPSLR